MILLDGPHPNHGGLTYFVGCKGRPIVKIGKSMSKFRHVSLRGPEKQDTFPILCIRGESLELRFHAAFEPFHVGKEWFWLAGPVARAIEQLKAGSFDFSSLPDLGWCVTKSYQVKASITHWGTLTKPGRVAA